jgi:hypothetical protein
MTFKKLKKETKHMNKEARKIEIKELKNTMVEYKKNSPTFAAKMESIIERYISILKGDIDGWYNGTQYVRSEPITK